MKKTLIAALLFLSSFSNYSHAGIPVIDGANLAQTIQQVLQTVTQITQQVEQITAAQAQLATANDTLSNMMGSRGMAGVISSLYDPAMTVDPNAILTSYGVSSALSMNLSGAHASRYNTQNQQAATYLGQTTLTLNQAQARYTQLLQLVAAVDNAPEQKDILDLQARIGAENVILQNEVVKLMALNARNEADRQMMERKMIQAEILASGTAESMNFR